MQNSPAEDLLAFFDNAPLNSRYWITFAVMSAVVMFDFFDFLVVGYLLAAVAREWHLTYGQSAVILYSGGIGAIIGAMLFGGLADAWGRKQQVVVGTVICALTSGLIAVLPAGSWLLFATLRFFVGVGLSAALAPSIALIVELTPTRYRTTMTSFYLVFVSAGGFLAPATSAVIMGTYGWRGVALLGFLALIIATLVWKFTRESVRWLLAKGRFVEARAEAARYVGLPLECVPRPHQVPPLAPPRGNLLDLLSQPRMFCETVLTWAVRQPLFTAFFCGDRPLSHSCWTSRCQKQRHTFCLFQAQVLLAKSSSRLSFRLPDGAFWEFFWASEVRRPWRSPDITTRYSSEVCR